MSALTHLSADDAAWAEAMLAEWACEELGRPLSSNYTPRQFGNDDARRWLTGFDPEQAAANEGICIYFADDDPPPAPIGAKCTAS